MIPELGNRRAQLFFNELINLGSGFSVGPWMTIHRVVNANPMECDSLNNYSQKWLINKLKSY